MSKEVPLKRKVHPIADLFPMMTNEELDELAGSIRANGLLSPVVVDTENRVLDGRNRLKACELAKVEPEFETYEGDADAYALAVNLDRRMLTKGQKAMIAAKALSVADSRQTATAKATGVAQSRISNAQTVLDHAPDLADAVVAGTWSLDQAYEEARSRKADLESDGRKLERLYQSAPDLADAVTEDRLALNEALAAQAERDRTAAEDQRDALTLLERIVGLVGDPTDVAEFVDAWAGRLGDVDHGLPAQTKQAGKVLLALAERIGG